MTTDFEPVYRSRPGAESIVGADAPAAREVSPGIWCSPGLSNAYLLTTSEGRIVVNTGMGFEGPVHRSNFDAVDAAPIRYVILTQGHVDHVGGIDALSDAGTEVVAHADWMTWRRDNEMLGAFRAANSSFAWIDKVMSSITYATDRFGGPPPPQGVPNPTILVEDRLDLSLGDRRLELLAAPGGETTDSLVVWLPDEKVCLCGNVFGALFGHIPNLVTLRGDRYRDALTVIDSIDRVRALGADVLLTGHFGPVTGRERIDWELGRLRDAVTYIHDETVAGMNQGKDVRTLMREVHLPPELEVGQGYGKVSWNVRAIWENYAGWFHHESTTELYPDAAQPVWAHIVDLAGAAALVDRARALLEDRDPVNSIRLAEMVTAVQEDHAGAVDVLRRAHQLLLEMSTNFWESAWLRQRIKELT